MIAGKRFRRIHRYRSIASAFARNGLGYVVQEMGLADMLPFSRQEERKEVHSKSIGERIRMLLEELGPTFVKLGQIASTRPDLIPPQILTELEKLQDHVPAFSFQEVSQIIQQELGAPVESLFDQFSETPLAAASMAQVHRAAFKDGTAVAVKVQRPNIESLIETDLNILDDWARLAESRLEWARRYRLREIVDELGRALKSEMNFLMEARNAEKFAEQSKAWDHVRVPDVYWDYCTSRVVTMEFVEGIKLSDVEQLDRAGLDRTVLAERLATSIFQQVLEEGFFHGDPHPGNVLVEPNGNLVLLDFGMVGRLTPQMKRHFASFVIALRNQSTKGVIRAISNMGIVPEDISEDALYADVDEMRGKYYKVPLKQVSIGEAVQDLLTLALRHRIQIPAELTLLGKTFLTLEGVVTALDPTFSVFDVAEPFGKKLYLERFNPQQFVKSWMEDWPDYLDLLRDMPLSLKQLTAMAKKGKVQLEVSSPQLEALMKTLDRISNRLSFSIMLLSLSIVIVGLMIGAAIGDDQYLLWRIPIIEICFVLAILLFAWLIYAIFRSGRF